MVNRNNRIQKIKPFLIYPHDKKDKKTLVFSKNHASCKPCKKKYSMVNERLYFIFVLLFCQ